MAEKCIIDHDFRRIDIPERKRLLGVQGDANVNIMEFRCPRYYGPTDMNDFTIRVNYVNAGADFNYSDDLELTAGGSGDDAYLDFAWVVPQDACA